MISSPNGIEKLPGDGARHGRSGAHGGSDGVNAVRGGGAGAEADSRERMGGTNAGRVRHGESQREKRGGGAYGEDGRVHGVGETERREESGGNDAEKEDSRDFGDAVVRTPASRQQVPRRPKSGLARDDSLMQEKRGRCKKRLRFPSSSG